MIDRLLELILHFMIFVLFCLLFMVFVVMWFIGLYEVHNTLEAAWLYLLLTLPIIAGGIWYALVQ